MDILWFCNIALPEACALLGKPSTPYGGWIVNISGLLANEKDIRLSIAFPEKNAGGIKVLQGKKITYYVFPSVAEKSCNINTHNASIQKIIDTVKPDVTHIFGTEYPSCLAILNCCNAHTTVIHIQGLVSVYQKHYYAALPLKVLKNYTLRDFIKRDNMIGQRRRMKEVGQYEIEALKLARHATGRTTWDYACVKQINPEIRYHFCNETLREELYRHEWDIAKCQKHSILTSQGQYPIKGLHCLLEAMTIVLQKYPDTILYVGGPDMTGSPTLRGKIKQSYYGKYIRELIQKHGLGQHVVFTGVLDEQQMCSQYQKAHVFVCPSSIENSPNSLGEAMILGVPCVASDVGGIRDMLVHDKEGYLYPFDEPYMLAYYVCRLFEKDDVSVCFSKKARAHAQLTHNRQNNLQVLLKIYDDIANGAKEL